MSRQAVWDPVQYGVFGDERARPFFELVGRIGGAEPRYAADLGCGTGELTAALAARWPGAIVEAIDGSPEMIAEARPRGIPGRLEFAVGDVRSWRPRQAPDVIVSNAVLQWVPEHRELLPRWMEALAPGGRLAFQVPGNFDAPSHAVMRELAGSRKWSGRLEGVLRADPVLGPEGYLDLLAPLGYAVDAWETTYMQVLHGNDPVLEWVKGTALRPVLSALGADAEEFLDEYRVLLREAYPAASYGTVFPFRRVFVIASRNAP
ncbi:trans-aconitate 2-methyltransferase [Actinomadura fibrosa]|uniref:Trans-aconitate 2-methyltransferase n=1 Tax=Actinomadura fibrosa TaxID=111802 RepID=A0ABW2XKY0_9ACTN|nr:trans-aconitate 2-methyltransferase [Actinomadura fibrosa]